MKINTMPELYMHELKELYDAENQLVEALPKMAKAATNPELKAAFEQHLAETEQHVTRLEQVFADCEAEPEREKSTGIKGIVAEGEKLIGAIKDPAVLDAALIAVGQEAEHFEMAAYGTLIAWARAAGWDEEVTLLEHTLREEELADEMLTGIAESSVYFPAGVDR